MNARARGVNKSESGFASIVIAVVLVLVLSLMTVGFAQLMRNEERSALDRHLSNQAYYAAESGINDAAKAINSGFSQRKTQCGPWTGTPTAGSDFLTDNKVGSDSTSSYTCLLIDPTPLSLEYSSVDDATNSRVFEITGIDPDDTNTNQLIKYIEVSWQDNGAGTTFAPTGANTFPKSSDWSYPGVIRISLTPLASGYVGRKALMDTSFTAYLYPNQKAAADPLAIASDPTTAPVYSAASGNGAQAGPVLNGRCDANNAPRKCNLTIKDLGGLNYLVDLRSIYNSSRVTLTAWGYDGRQLRLKNAQTMVDSTGKAQDIVRRVQVRIPSKNTYVRSNYVLETTGNICKQYQLTPDADSTKHCDP